METLFVSRLAVIQRALHFKTKVRFVSFYKIKPASYFFNIVKGLMSVPFL